MTAILVGAGFVSLLSSAMALFVLRVMDEKKKFANRVAAIRRSAGIAESGPGTATTSPARLVAMLGSFVISSGLLSTKTIAGLNQTLTTAGLAGEKRLGFFIGMKLLLLICLPVLIWFGSATVGVSPLVHNVLTLVGAIIGLLGPDIIAKKIRARYLKALGAGLPDALDMLVICSEAGMGLEPSISRVAAEIGYAHPIVATELQQTASELRIISDRRLALQNMGTRTGLEGLKRLGATLIQTTKYGTPLSQALRTLSAEMRAETLTEFEERAAKLPVLLTVPMIVFILPTVFVVVGGPAMLQAMARMHH